MAVMSAGTVMFLSAQGIEWLVEHQSIKEQLKQLNKRIDVDYKGIAEKIEEQIGSWYVNNASAAHVRLKDMEIVVSSTAPIT